MVGRDILEPTAVRLDFFELMITRVVAVGATDQSEADALRSQADLGLITFSAASGDEPMAFAALLC